MEPRELMEPRERGSENGAALVELAMVVLPLMMLLLGLVEIGGAWKDKSTAIQASRQGARVVTASETAVTAGADRDALRAILATIPDGLSGGSELQIRKVVIFDATGSDATVQANRNSCINIDASLSIDQFYSGVTNVGTNCNVYVRGNNGSGGDNRASLLLSEIDATSPDDWFNGGAADWDAGFRATSRNNSVGQTGLVGVYVELYRPWVTGFFPGEGILVTGETIMRIEPPGP